MKPGQPLAWGGKVRLALSVWYWYLRIRYRLRRADLPAIVQWLATPPPAPTAPVDPRRLGRIVARCLPYRLLRGTCLPQSLTLFRLLHLQGLGPELVIGLPAQPKSPEAHAWIELGGRDVGPPPGGRLHRPFARYRADSRDPASPRG
jgi:hypothetical protein